MKRHALGLHRFFAESGPASILMDSCIRLNAQVVDLDVGDVDTGVTVEGPLHYPSIGTALDNPTEHG